MIHLASSRYVPFYVILWSYVPSILQGTLCTEGINLDQEVQSNIPTTQGVSSYNLFAKLPRSSKTLMYPNSIDKVANTILSKRKVSSKRPSTTLVTCSMAHK
ncbi:hypothetical protein HPP92_027701 [Vanilla planifolia]|uniref:Uncharacterized protein n=1 Tax=Vanilla planifolia TaxID=51239 RepID=A0A835PA98_VANPL|nr:hypothetical protein HPP92_027701 [Vanilla planifolia]